MQDYFPVVVQVIPLDNYHVQVFLIMGRSLNTMQQVFYKVMFLNLCKIYKRSKTHVLY